MYSHHLIKFQHALKPLKDSKCEQDKVAHVKSNFTVEAHCYTASPLSLHLKMNEACKGLLCCILCFVCHQLRVASGIKHDQRKTTTIILGLANIPEILWHQH